MVGSVDEERPILPTLLPIEAFVSIMAIRERCPQTLQGREQYDEEMTIKRAIQAEHEIPVPSD